MRARVVVAALITAAAVSRPVFAKDGLASRLKRPLGHQHLEAGEVWVEGVAATHVADYFDRGTADTFTTVTAADGGVFMFTDLVAYTGETVQFHATKEAVSLAGVPDGWVSASLVADFSQSPADVVAADASGNGVPHANHHSPGGAPMRRSLLGPVPDLDLVQGGRRLFAPPMDPHGLNSIAVFRVGFLLPNGSYIYPNGTEEELRGIIWSNPYSVHGLYQDVSDGFGFLTEPDSILLTVNISSSLSQVSCNFPDWASQSNQYLSTYFGQSIFEFTMRLYILPIGAGGGDCDWNGIATIGCDRTTCGAWVMGPIGDLISHELGHNVGFNHASTDVNNDGVKDIEYGDISCPMGSEPARRSFKRFHVMHRVEASWLSSSAIVDVYGAVLPYMELHTASNNPWWTSDKVLIHVHRGAANFYLSYRTLEAPDSVHYDRNLTAAYHNHVFVHRFAYGANTVLQARVAVGESYLNAPLGFAMTFVSEDPDTQVARVALYVCRSTTPYPAAPASVDVSGACSTSVVSGVLPLQIVNPSIDCGNVSVLVTVSGLGDWAVNGWSTCASLNVTVVPDVYPNETSWKIQRTPGPLDPLFSNVKNNLTGVFVPSFCQQTSQDVLTFSIQDTFADGICCMNGIGRFEVQYGGATIIKGGEFAASSAASFRLVPTFSVVVPSNSSQALTLNLTAPMGSVPTRRVLNITSSSVLGTTFSSVEVSLGCDGVFSTRSATPSMTPSPSPSPTPSVSCEPQRPLPPALDISPSTLIRLLSVDCTAAQQAQMSVILENDLGNCPANAVTVAEGLPSQWRLGGRGVCQDIIVMVRPDSKPEESSWTLSSLNPRTVLMSSAARGSLNASLTGYCGTPGQLLEFALLDSGGDGLCCASGVGAYSVTIGGVVVASGSTFSTSAVATFRNLPTWSGFLLNGLQALLETRVTIPAGVAVSGNTSIRFTSTLPTGSTSVNATVQISCRGDPSVTPSTSPSPLPSLTSSPTKSVGSPSRSGSRTRSVSRTGSSSTTRSVTPSRASRSKSPSRSGSGSRSLSRGATPSRSPVSASISSSRTKSVSRVPSRSSTPLASRSASQSAPQVPVLPSPLPSNSLVLVPDSLFMWWAPLSPTATSINMTFQCLCTGWFAFGIGSNTPATMVGADVIMMRVVNGTGEAIDSYSNGYALPVADTVSNVVLLSASESNGVSTISIRRPLGTASPQDQPFAIAESMGVIGAFSPTSDRFAYHGINRASTTMYVTRG